MGLLIEREKLAELGKKLKEQGKSIVSTNGCFDILHVGHTRILAESRGLGDVLVVGLNSDDSVARLKGSSRPVNKQDDRAELLCALSCVDYVSIFPEDTPVEFLKLLKPNIHVKGADYKPEQLEETPVVEENGGKVVILQLVPGRSTTKTIAKMREV
ncbi:MAG: D-glycero-beta-D-manno-heptose 1-phosphate adenylyltransferase [Candidatus Obscuribacterales bacterium]|nr:D-glycero-beta-D-manno-heptose 1-phosphate adenylyltransferase [Candidatus Obscuribacterales bacterium]